LMALVRAAVERNRADRAARGRKLAG